MGVRKLVVLAAVAVMAAPTLAESGWRSIGHAQVSAGAASATIAARESGSYREFILCLDGGPARLTDAIVHYRDDRVQTYRLRTRLAAGACTRAAGLSGRDRTIASVEISYDPASLQGAGPRLELSVR